MLPYYQKAIELDMLEGLSGLSVDKTLTRAETAQLVYNMLKTETYAGFVLEDVVFNGMGANVKTVTPAWVIETPLQYFEENGRTLDPEEEKTSVVVALQDSAETLVIDLKTEDVEDYFGATLDIINLEDEEYDFITNIKINNRVTTDIVYPEKGDKFKVNGKSYTEADITFVTPTEDGYQTVALEDYKTIESDMIFIDTDNSGKYDLAIIYPYNIAEYSAPKKDAETCGVMVGEEDVVYSEDLEKDEIFVYTYDPLFKFVNVKNYVCEFEGKINSYKVDEDDNHTVIIDKKTYKIDSVNIFKEVETELDNTDDLVTDFQDNIGKIVKFYAIDNTIFAFGGEVVEKEELNYLVATNDYEDWVKKSHVVMNAIIDGEEKTIKVKKIYDTNGIVVNIEKDTNTKIQAAFDGEFTVFSYKKIGGYYTLTKIELPNKISDYFANTDYMLFEDFKAINPKGDRDTILRLDENTKIYLVNFEEATVKAITPTEEIFAIETTADTRFYADKIGYGPADTNGVASVVYITTSGATQLYDDYTVVYVPEETKEFEIILVEDEKYTRFAANAISLNDFDTIKYIYTTTTDKLVPGLYLIDEDNVVIDSSTLGEEGTITLNEEFVVYYETINKGAFGLDIYYDIKTIIIDSINITEETGITDIVFETISGKTYRNEKILELIEDNDGAIKVIIKPNRYNGHNDTIPYSDNTVYGLVISE